MMRKSSVCNFSPLKFFCLFVFIASLLLNYLVTHKKEANGFLAGEWKVKLIRGENFRLIFK